LDKFGADFPGVEISQMHVDILSNLFIAI
jgi:hypothetical protein